MAGLNPTRLAAPVTVETDYSRHPMPGQLRLFTAWGLGWITTPTAYIAEADAARPFCGLCHGQGLIPTPFGRTDTTDCPRCC